MTVEHASPDDVPLQRFNELLTSLADQGYSQQQVASEAGVSPQYLSELKHGRRKLSELACHRFATAFSVHPAWLRGEAVDRAASAPTSQLGATFYLPLLAHPIEGEPCAQVGWNGMHVAIAGPAAVEVPRAKSPYVLQFKHGDPEQRRLRAGDLLLMSQATSLSAEIQVVKHGGKLFLARNDDEGGWRRVANGDRLPAAAPVLGHALAIIFGSLKRPQKNA